MGFRFVFADHVLFRISRTGRLAETWWPGDRRRKRVRHLADQGQDTRVHAKRRTATDDRDVHHSGSGPSGQHGAGVQEQWRHVRQADRKLAGPVVAREPKRRSRRGRGHYQEQVVFAALYRYRRRGRRCDFCGLRGHHRPGGPYRDHSGDYRARRQLAPDHRPTTATAATTVH